LVIDFAQSMFYVTSDLVTKSDKTPEDWLAVAIENLRKRTSAAGFAMLHEESGLRQGSAGDTYDSSRAMLLDFALPEFSEHGFLVAVPGRDELLVLPVTQVSLQFLPLLKAIAQKNFTTVPYPISSDIFWIKDGTWHAFAIELDGARANIRPPAEFVPILRE